MTDNEFMIKIFKEKKLAIMAFMQSEHPSSNVYKTCDGDLEMCTRIIDKMEEEG